MSLNLDKTTWKRVRLGDVIRRSRAQADPANGDVDRYVGGGHIDSDSLTIERFGDVDDGQMGSTFTYLFQPGQILFVSARPYLRKSGVVNFSGVVADKTYVLDAVPENGLLQEFLPFVLASDHFIAYATAEATGSMNPRLLWGRMQRYEFDLPPLDEQQRLADLLWAVERDRQASVAGMAAARAVLTQLRSDAFGAEGPSATAGELFDITIGRQRSPKHEVGEHMVPYLRSANVTLDGIDLSDVKQMNFTPDEQAKFCLESGDVLVSEGSASATAVGMPAVWRGELAGAVCFQNTLLRYRAIDGVSLPGFVEHWCAWAFETGAFLRASSGTNIHHIGVKGASGMDVRRLPLEEQSRFLARAAAAASAVSAISAAERTSACLRDQLLGEIVGGAQ
ncbi:restriction endonuclease subunit S [Streptomyces sp. NPDC048241]|uniref:restriction endonuclease subunit S n=1 Tax=Streptomyces sp. NPDC048241 TaxID=3365521 RepID=UPI0037102414